MGGARRPIDRRTKLEATGLRGSGMMGRTREEAREINKFHINGHVKPAGGILRSNTL